jgi:hypothetical protein
MIAKQQIGTELKAGDYRLIDVTFQNLAEETHENLRIAGFPAEIQT